jgi:predicted Zn-dependent peptidase
MKLLVLPRDSDRTVRLFLAVFYGSNNDLPEKAGLAHFLEHMLTQGSDKRIRIARKSEDFGGLNCSTGPDYSISFAQVLPKKISEVVESLSEITFDGVFEEARLERERRVIFQEIEEFSDNPWKKIHGMLKKALFNLHPIRLPIAGFHETVAHLSLEEVTKAHQINYFPRNMIFGLIGKCGQNQTELIENYDWPYHGKKSLQKSAFVEDGKPTRKDLVEKGSRADRAYFGMGARTVPASHPDSCILDTIRVLLGGGFSSRLYVELREKRGLAYSVFSNHPQGFDYGYLGVFAAVENKNFEKAIRIVKTEFSKIRDGELSNKELNRAKGIVEGRIAKNLDDPFMCPLSLVESEFFSNGEKSITDYLRRLKAVTRNDIQEAASKYLGDNNLSTIALIS